MTKRALFFCAALLGGWLLRDVLKLMKAANFTQPAWTLYRNSLLYLALLFAAMAVDGLVPQSRRMEPSLMGGRDVSAPIFVKAPAQ